MLRPTFRKPNSRGMALLPILAMTFLFTTVGGTMLYMSNQRRAALYDQVFGAQTKLANNSALGIASSVLDAQVVRGFTVVTPPNATYWTVYPATAPVGANGFTFSSGIVPAPNDPNVVPTAQMSIADLCNPATMNAPSFGNMMTAPAQPPACGTAGANPATCCYHIPSNIRLMNARSGQYLEVVSRVGDPMPAFGLSTQVPNLPPTGKGQVNTARIRIPALAPLPPPDCNITYQYQNIWWHQYDLAGTFRAAPPADFAWDTRGFSARLRFPATTTAPDQVYPPGLINGSATSVTTVYPLDINAANAGGQSLLIRPRDIGNITATFTLPGEVEGPGGVGFCPTPFTQFQLPVTTTCSIVPQQTAIYWLDQTYATYTQPIPAPPAQTAPLPPAYLNLGRMTAVNATVQNTNQFDFPLSISNNSLGGILIRSTGPNPGPGTTSAITLNGVSRNEAGWGNACSRTITIRHVGPPTCRITVVPARNGSTAGIVYNVTTSPPSNQTFPGLNQSLYMPTSVVVAEYGYNRSFSQTYGGGGGSLWIRPPSAANVTYVATVTGPSGSSTCQASIAVGNAGCSMYANPNPSKMSDPVNAQTPGDWRSTLTLSTNDWTDSAWGQDHGALPFYGGSWLVVPGSCWGPGPSNPVHYTGSATGIGGTHNCSTDLYLTCPDKMIGGFMSPGCSVFQIATQAPGCTGFQAVVPFQDYCIYPLNTDQIGFGTLNPPIAPHTNTITLPNGVVLPPTAFVGPVYKDAQGRWVNCADAEYAVNSPPTCMWIHCGAVTYGACNNRGCVGGCFDLNTNILMGDKSLKKAMFVRAGDLLWNPIRQKAMKVRKIILGPENFKLFEIGPERGRTVRVSKEHPMVTRAGLKRADEVKLGDEILLEGSKYEPIRILERIPIAHEQKVINFDLETDIESADEHMLVADGIITGDWFLQEKLDKAAKNKKSVP